MLSPSHRGGSEARHRRPGDPIPGRGRGCPGLTWPLAPGPAQSTRYDGGGRAGGPGSGECASSRPSLLSTYPDAKAPSERPLLKEVNVID